MGSGLVLLLCVGALSGCSPAPVITIANRAPVVLTNVVVSGSGFSHRVESIAPGAEGTVTVKPRGESDLRIAFDAADRHVDVGDLAYIEASGGYRVAISVSPDLSVSAVSDIKGY